MKKICIVTPMSLPVPAIRGGAVENLITIFLTENEKYGDYQITLYTIFDKNLKNEYHYTQLKTIRFPKLILVLRKLFFTFSHFWKIEKPNLFYTVLYKKIGKEMRKEQYDFVLVENNMDLYREIYRKNPHFSYLFHLHNDLNGEDKTEENYRFIASTASKILVVSSFLQKKLNQVYPSDRLVVIENVIDQEKYCHHKKDVEAIKRKKETLLFSEKDWIIGYAGRIEKEKGLLELIEAFNMANIPDAKLLLVCEDFLHSTYLNEQIKKLGAAVSQNKENIVITGKVPYEEMITYYDLMDVLVIPTICEEAFGMVALEGKALDKKIVYSNSGALRDVLKGMDAIEVPNDSMIVNHLAEVLKSKEVRMREPHDIQPMESYLDYYQHFKDVIQ